MGRLTDNVWQKAMGGSDAREAGYDRTLRGMREGDRRELYMGLVLTAISYLQRTKPKKELLYRKEVPEGAALVIHHKKSGEARLEIIKPNRRRKQ